MPTIVEVVTAVMWSCHGFNNVVLYQFCYNALVKKDIWQPYDGISIHSRVLFADCACGLNMSSSRFMDSSPDMKMLKGLFPGLAREHSFEWQTPPIVCTAAVGASPIQLIALKGSHGVVVEAYMGQPIGSPI
eukprot:scaffold81649_cov18-Prasinocladus_malaysianus.AAC.1